MNVSMHATSWTQAALQVSALANGGSAIEIARGALPATFLPEYMASISRV